MNRTKTTVRTLRSMVRRTGFDVVRYPGRDAHHLRSRFLQTLGVDVVLDVGANIGQYGTNLRAHGYSGKIVSFEPMNEAFTEISSVAAADGNWEVVQTALGGSDGELEINVAGNSISSSLLPMLDRHKQYAPHSRYVGKETVHVRRLDEVARTALAEAKCAFLKIDTQGYEASVLDGATEALAGLAAIELELSLVPLYEGQALMHEMMDRMRDSGFRLAGVTQGLVDADGTGETMQVDGIFLRT